MNQIQQLLHDDGQLDKDTLRLIGAVLRRVEVGDTHRQITEHLRYRRRIADGGEEKTRVRRVSKALRTNRWGLRDLVERVRTRLEGQRRSVRLSNEARQAFYAQIETANNMIPDNKRGRGGSGGRGRKDDRRWQRRKRPGTLI